MFLIAGEALIDMVAAADGSFRPVPGGAPFNFARALALQELPSLYANPFSGDAFGELLRRTLTGSGAACTDRTSGRPTSLALVSTDANGHPHYAFYREGVADRELTPAMLDAFAPGDLLGFHTGALALVPPDHETVLGAAERLRAANVLVTVDVNMRPQVAASQGVDLRSYGQAALAAIGVADIVKVSDEDLVNLGFGGPAQVAARALLDLGPRIVVLTRGAEGAHAMLLNEEVYQQAPATTIVDTVGAGDCFFAGFIAALHKHRQLAAVRDRAPAIDVVKQALHHAAVCAAINISRQGCQPPTWEEAQSWSE